MFHTLLKHIAILWNSFIVTFLADYCFFTYVSAGHSRSADREIISDYVLLSCSQFLADRDKSADWNPKEIGKRSKRKYNCIIPPVSLEDMLLYKRENKGYWKAVNRQEDSDPVESSSRQGPDNDDINLKFLRAPSFFVGADEELSDRGAQRVIVYRYDGLPMQPVVPPSPDYVLGPEHPPSPDYVPSPEHPPSLVEVPYVPEPEYPEYLVLSDAEAPLQDQPLPTDASPVALSLGYVANSDPEEDPEEDHADYPADGGDDDDEPSDDDTDDEDEEPFEDEDNNEEEECLALADSSAVPVVDPVLSVGDTEAFETDESAPTPVPSPRRHTARISIRPEAPMPFPYEEEVERLLALPPPPPSPRISLSPPSAEERLARCLAAPTLPSSPFPIVPHPYGSPNYVRAPPSFRAAMGRLRSLSPWAPMPFPYV
ncbi:hypothetical protein Tco_1064407 [Tanacetum coccineum]